MASVSVYYHEQHALDSPLPVIGVSLHVVLLHYIMSSLGRLLQVDLITLEGV